jgi:hypothetical protein
MEYHKINGLYKRWRKDLHNKSELPDGVNFGDFIIGDFAQQEFEYLFNNQWIWSEKLDGTNIRIYANWSEQYGIHTFEVKGKQNNSSIPKDLLEWIKDWIDKNAQIISNLFVAEDIILYGEGVGTKIQKVGHNFGSQHFKLFDVYINGFWLQKDNVLDIARKLSLDTPITWTGTIQDAIDKVKTLPVSSFGNFTIEGYVGQPIVRLNDAQQKRITTKIKVCDFVKGKK